MLREIPIGGFLVPALLIWFVLWVPAFFLLDLGLARIGSYRLFWHPALARVALFVSLLSLSFLLWPEP